MTTAFVLPGLNSLLNPKARTRFLDVPEAQARLHAAEKLFQSRRKDPTDLNALLRLPTEKIYSRPLIDRAAAAIVALQTGVADRLIRVMGKPAWVVGCSLGDLARTVIAGSCSFETALTMPLAAPQNEAGADQIGAHVAVMTASGRPFDEVTISRITSLGIAVSMLSPTLLGVSGSFADIEELRALAAELRWRILPLVNYPVHSHHLAPFRDSVLGELRGVSFELPDSDVRIFSTLLRKPIETRDELRYEMENSLTRPHHWHRSVETLIRDHGVTDFVNVGPCQTLSKLLRHFPARIRILEPEEILA